ncbi:MAG: hypothetical protein KAU28_03030, partial [Phycisphaerae bacterium]|nr:hypothetical protein [Phycisphaerae bacterium]
MYKQRIKIFLVVIGVVFVAIIARLGHIQIIEGRHWAGEAERLLHRRPHPLPAKRGRILDRRNNILAEDYACFDLSLDYRFIILRDKGPDERKKDKWLKDRLTEIEEAENVSFAEAEKIFLLREAQAWQLARRIAEDEGVDLEHAVARIKRRVQAIRRHIGMPVRIEQQAHPVVSGLDDASGLGGTVGAVMRPSWKRHYP